jgi:serine protease AprX
MLSSRVICLLLSMALAAPSYAAAQGTSRKPKGASVDRVLRDAERLPEKVRVIVQYRPGTRNGVSKRLAENGARVRHHHQGIGAIAVELPRGLLKHLASDPDVVGLSSDAIVGSEQLSGGDSLDGQSILRSAALTSSVNLSTSFDAQSLRSTLGIQTADTGDGVGVAIIDSGIAPSNDLQGRIAAFYDFTQGGVATQPYDDYGHGTHIAGLIAGNGQQSKVRYVGVASSARLIGLKVLDSNGSGYSSDVIAAIEFAIANRVNLGIDIINLSLGHPIYESVATDPMVRAVERAVAAGIVVVVSAGNTGTNDATGQIGYAGITSPGNAPSALTVGALRTKATGSRLDDEVATFSARGPTWYDGLIKPDVVAPGQALVAINASHTTLYQNAALRADQAPYLRLSGTSMAAGVTSGVVALVIEANRKDEGASSALTPNAVKALLQYTAIPVADPDPSTSPLLEQGAGAINAAGAIALARAIDPSMPVGSSWLEYGVLPVTLIAGIAHPWVQHIVWGDHLVWGDTITWNLPAWATHVVWGEDDQHVVWGDGDEHIVWGDDDAHVVWGDRFLQGPNVLFDSFGVWSTQIVWGDALVSRSIFDEHIVWGDLSAAHLAAESTAGSFEN